MIRTTVFAAAILAALALVAVGQSPPQQNTGFTYQGELTRAGQPVDAARRVGQSSRRCSTVTGPP